MREGFREAIETRVRMLGRVHLGNCSMRDKSDRFYGDNYPPIGYSSGEITSPPGGRRATAGAHGC